MSKAHQVAEPLLPDTGSAATAANSRQHAGVDELLPDISARLVSVGPDEVEELVDHALRRLGEATGADRTFFMYSPEDEPGAREIYEWCRQGVEPRRSKLQGGVFPSRGLAARLMKEGHLFVPSVSQLPDEAAVERAGLESRGIRSVALVPAMCRDKLAGVLAVEPLPSTLMRSQTERAHFKTLCNLLAGALQQQKYQLGLARRTTELRESHSSLDHLVAAAPGVLFRARPDMSIRFVSPNAEKLWGYAAEEVMAPGFWREHLHPDDSAGFGAALSTLGTAVAEHAVVECRLKMRGDAFRWQQVTMWLERTGDERHSDICAFCEDMDERKQADAKLREEIAQIGNAIDLAMDAVVTVGADHRIILFNRAAEKMFGYPADEALGQPLDMLIPSRFRGTHRRYVARYSKTEYTTRSMEAMGRVMGLRADGEEFPIEASISQATVRGEKALTVIMRDITRRTAAERALKESEELFRHAFMYAPIGVALVAPDGRYLQVNRSMCNMLGYAEQELLQKSFMDITYPDDVEADLATMQLMLKGELGSYVREKRYIHKQGHPVWTVLTVSPVRNAAGEVYCFVTQMLDVTERNRSTELALAKETAEQANRAKSEFLSRMSHELRTPLNSILGFAQLLQMEELGPEHQDSVRYIVKGGQHLLQLINEVLDISRIEVGSMFLSTEPVSLTDLLQECLDLAQPMAVQRGIRLQAEDLGHRDMWAMADNQRLKQVLLNLITNAIKYNHEGGSVSLSCLRLDRARGGCSVRIVIRDTGPGIPLEKQVRLFSPFDRLGAEQTSVEGTGLGLALSKRLVEAMQGTIGVESTPGKGSAFWVELPVAEEAGWPGHTTSGRLTTSHLTEPHGEHTVLYIEDNLSNLKLVERILERRPGIRLLSAMRGGLGLELARHHKPDLILLDVHLPDMAGEQVLRGLRDAPETHDLPVIVISADASPDRANRLKRAGAQVFLTKPLDIKTFDRAVRQILE